MLNSFSKVEHLREVFQNIKDDPFGYLMKTVELGKIPFFRYRGGASFEIVGWTRGKIYCQKVYLMFLISF